MREDLEIAKRILKNESISLVIVKESKILYKSSASGIRGLIEAIEDLKDDMHDSSVADKVVGRAAALLLAYSRVGGVYAEILSEEGMKALKENNIAFEFERTVPIIFDKSRREI